MKLHARLRAFTLIELLIVITIIGILAVAIVPRLTGGPEKARDAQRKSDLQQLSTALTQYADDNDGAYPAAFCIHPDDTDSDVLGDYMTTIPTDPLSGNFFSGDVVFCGGGGGNPDAGYTYIPINGNRGFMLFAELENTKSNSANVYRSNGEGDGVAGGDLDADLDAGDNLDIITALDCGTLDGTADECDDESGVVYVIAR